MPLIEKQPDALAQVYARSLFELAGAEGGRDRAEEVLGELEAVLELARGDNLFGEFLASRVISSRARQESLIRIFEGRLSGLVVRFLRLLNAKGRLSHLPPIAVAYESLVQDAFGRVEVDLYTAGEIDGPTREAFRSKLAQSLGKEIILHTYVDPAMLGGVKFRIGDRLVDDSLATQLSRMRDRLSTDGYARLRARSDRTLES